MKKTALALVVLLASTAASWAADSSTTNAAAKADANRVVVFAAASLTASFQAMAAAFEKAHPGQKVLLNFAGSPTLVQQIQQGAPADVFASADEAHMQKLVQSGDIPGTPQTFARNKLEIAVAPGNPRKIESLGDLGKPGLVIALCGPGVPCGRYATEAFGKAGVAVPQGSQEPDVKAVLSKVTAGEADAGIVYTTDVRAAGEKVAGVEIPESANVMAQYPIVVVKNAANRSAAEAFIAFVLSAPGQQLLSSFGFLSR